MQYKPENDVVDAEIVEPIVETPIEIDSAVPVRIKNNIKTMLVALSAAVNGGEMKSGQAAEIRRRFGISQRYFTKKKYSFAKVKARRRVARLSRVKNRGLGKGEKRTGGL